jgi:uncharacterized protein YodC (DUF2158 family)
LPFNLGEVVELKSSSPHMTVTKLPDPDANNEVDRTHYSCTWWNNPLSKYDTAKFLDEALVVVPVFK